MSEHTLTKNQNSVAETTRNGKYFMPRVDIYEKEDELLLFADMPGVKPEDIDLRYEQGELRLHGKVTRRPHQGTLVFAEYQEGDFYRVFQIHETIDSTRIEGELKNGVLVVHLPKVEKARPRQVTIKAD